MVLLPEIKFAVEADEFEIFSVYPAESFVLIVTVSLPTVCAPDPDGVTERLNVPPLEIVITEATATLTVVVEVAAETIVEGSTNNSRKDEGIIKKYFFIKNF
jgi:hypothetical protein